MLSQWLNFAGLCLDFGGFAGLTLQTVFDARDLRADRAYLARKGTIEERVDFIESPLIVDRVRRADRRARFWIIAAAIVATGYALQIAALA